MSLRLRASTIISFLCILGGLLLFAYSQETNVFPDPGRVELGVPEPAGGPIGDPTFVVLSALLVTTGALTLAATRSPARGWGKAAALVVFGFSLFVFLAANFSLFINGIAITTSSDRAISFSASYLFHGGALLSFAGVYILFLFTLVLVALLVGSLGYLVAPHKFFKALGDRDSWGKNEAIHVATSLLLVLGLSVYFVWLLRLTGDTDVAAMRHKGALAQNLVSVYYLFILLLFFLILSIGAHVFLVNWGTHTPLERGELLKSVTNVARVERTLFWSTVGLNFLLLLTPSLESKTSLSNDPVFLISSRGFHWFYFLSLVPSIPYAISQRRLERLLRRGHLGVAQTAFSARSLRLVQQFLGGIVLLTVVAVAAPWQPLTVMLAYAAWTSGLLLYHSIHVRIRDGLPEPEFRSDASPPLYFSAFALALTTGLMMWGAGNTFEVVYQESTKSLLFVNESDFGQDIAARVGAATILAGSLVLSLHLISRSVAVPRRFLGHYLWMFILTSVAATTTFTVGVWTKGPNGLQDAYAGFSFRQYYGTEQLLVGLLLTATVIGLFWSLGRILGEIAPRMGTGREPGRARLAAR